MYKIKSMLPDRYEILMALVLGGLLIVALHHEGVL